MGRTKYTECKTKQGTYVVADDALQYIQTQSVYFGKALTRPITMAEIHNRNLSESSITALQNEVAEADYRTRIAALVAAGTIPATVSWFDNVQGEGMVSFEHEGIKYSCAIYAGLLSVGRGVR